MQNVTLAPFRAAIIEAGAVGLMASHGEIDGVPAHADIELLDDTLRQDWGFDGYVVSDWDDIRRIYSLHGVAANEAESAIMGLKAGVDIELANNGVYMMLPQLVRDGAISESFVRRAAERILRAKFKCGLFDLPFAQPEEAKRISRSAPHRALALKMAEESVVLLKNEDNLLPLDPKKSQQNELAAALLELGKPVITVLIHGRPLSPQLIAAKCPAILDAFYPGEEGGNAIAKILFGDVNPSGKLPVTLVRNVGQIPGFYYQQPTGRFRNYVDSDSTPLFPFGHGLSYTSFDVGAPQASMDEISVNDTVTVSVTVKNTGKIAGQEVVQLYVRDKIASRARPIKLLRGFEKVALEPGETRRVEFTLGPEDFGFRNAEGELQLEPGQIIIMSGANSEDLKQSLLMLT